MRITVRLHRLEKSTGPAVFVIDARQGDSTSTATLRFMFCFVPKSIGSNNRDQGKRSCSEPASGYKIPESVIKRPSHTMSSYRSACRSSVRPGSRILAQKRRPERPLLPGGPPPPSPQKRKNRPQEKKKQKKKKKTPRPNPPDHRQQKQSVFKKPRFAVRPS